MLSFELLLQNYNFSPFHFFLTCLVLNIFNEPYKNTVRKSDVPCQKAVKCKNLSINKLGTSRESSWGNFLTL